MTLQSCDYSISVNIDVLVGDVGSLEVVVAISAALLSVVVGPGFLPDCVAFGGLRGEVVEA
jgi:hypothetical protein